VKGDLNQDHRPIVYEAANDGDEWALEVVHETASLLGAAVASFLNIFQSRGSRDLRGVTQAGDKLFNPLRSEVKRRAFKPAWEAWQDRAGNSARDRRGVRAPPPFSSKNIGDCAEATGCDRVDGVGHDSWSRSCSGRRAGMGGIS